MNKKLKNILLIMISLNVILIVALLIPKNPIYDYENKEDTIINNDEFKDYKFNNNELKYIKEHNLTNNISKSYLYDEKYQSNSSNLRKIDVNGFLFNDNNQMLINIKIPLSMVKGNDYYLDTSINYKSYDTYISYKYKNQTYNLKNDINIEDSKFNNGFINHLKLKNDFSKISMNDVIIEYSIFFSLLTEKDQYIFMIQEEAKEKQQSVSLGFSSFEDYDPNFINKTYYFINKGGN